MPTLKVGPDNTIQYVTSGGDVLSEVEYDAASGSLQFVDETGSPAPAEFGDTTHQSVNTGDGPIDFDTAGRPFVASVDNAMAFQPDNTDGDIHWEVFADDGSQVMGTMAFHTHLNAFNQDPAQGDAEGNEAHWKWYTLNDDLSNDPTQQTRLAIGAGSKYVDYNLLRAALIDCEVDDVFRIKGSAESPSARFRLRPLSGGGNSRIEFHDTDGSDSISIQHYPGANLQIYNHALGETSLKIVEVDNEIRFNQNETTSVVWEVTTTAGRPSNPVRGERVFDDDLGQPIWYDGSNWVDAQGATV